ncbi:MAG TPA: hypothetical protein VEQ63_01570, partial [Bryobacteraceae bacterium]|nr:hypothetical protein [Bryobacteraceae bacterium]
MSSAAVVAVSELGRILRADDGVPGQVLGLQASAPVWLPPVSATDILDGFFSPDILEKSTPVKYPSFYIYCEKMTNRLLEKFRSFSGSAELVVEVRVSHDHIRELHEQLHWYVQSVTDVLERRRGKWTAGV